MCFLIQHTKLINKPKNQSALKTFTMNTPEDEMIHILF